MRALNALLLGLSACATTPTDVLGLLDAREDTERSAAVDKASRILTDARERIETRTTAARVLGRLRLPSELAITALSQCLGDVGTERLMRAWCARALAEMRSEASLPHLIAALRTPLDPATFEQVLEGVAKHFVIVSADSNRILEVVEAMIYAAGNQQTQPPPVYDLLSSKTRTVEVNIRVLARALEAAATKEPSKRAALYQASTEILERLDASRSEIVAGPEAWRARVREAIAGVRATLAVDDPRQRTLVLLWFGRYGDVPELGRPVAESLLANGKLPPTLLSGELELTGAWATSRLEMHGSGMRHAISKEILSRSRSAIVLRLIGDLVVREDALDGLQRILRLESGS